MKKRSLFLFVFALTCCLFTSCSKDDESNSINLVPQDPVMVNSDGTTSNGSRFVPVDDKNFYLDYIKYSVEEGHLAVTGYDKTGFDGNAIIYPSVSFGGGQYETMVIKAGAFQYCSDRLSLTIPYSITKIENNALPDNRGKLDKIVVDPANKVYDSRDNCNAVIETATNTLIYGSNKTVIPSTVTSIASSAFSGCSGLTSITIGDSVTYIGEEAFIGCYGLTSITIGNSVTSIGSYAFMQCAGLTSITIPNSISSIPDYAFYECTGLTSITIPNSVSSIGHNAFQGCLSLTSITIPNSVISIGFGAFEGCYRLTTATIGNGVTEIEMYAFENCSSLKEIHCKTTTPPRALPLGDNFRYDSCVLYVPSGTLNAYKATEVWKSFQNIIEE